MMYLKPKHTDYLNPKQKCDFWVSFSKWRKTTDILQENSADQLLLSSSFVSELHNHRNCKKYSIAQEICCMHGCWGCFPATIWLVGGGAFLRNQGLRRETAPQVCPSAWWSPCSAASPAGGFHAAALTGFLGMELAFFCVWNFPW